MKRMRVWLTVGAGVLGLVQLAGCPQAGPATEFVPGSTGDTGTLSDRASVDVFSPNSDLSIAGGTPIEVNWRALATTRFAVINVIVDTDTDPDNGNEIVALEGLALSQTSATVDTTRLEAGSYRIGVIVEEIGEIAASGYADGVITVNQRPLLSFTSPRDNFVFDRSESIIRRFDVSWTLSDPDSVVTVRVFLDPDGTPNGNEILLRESNSQVGDTFSFDLPTASFSAGTYRILALVSDSVDSFEFYAPGSIRLRARLASYIDLRDLGLPAAPVGGAIFEGFNPHDNAGSFVSSLRDVDGDGFDDIIVLSQFGKPQYQTNIQRTGAGEAYLIYGRANRFSGAINLNSTGTLYRGEIYGGVPEVPDPIRPTRGITSFALLSDWDGDGVRELAFGLPFVDSLAVGNLGAGTDAGLISPLDVNGYFRSGAVVIVSSSSLRPDLGFPGRNVFNLAEFGTLAHVAVADAPCAEGFYGPKSPAASLGSTTFHRHLVTVDGQPNSGSNRLGCRFSSNDFGDQFGEVISAYDFDSIIISVPNRDPIANTLFNNANNTSLPGAGVVSIYYDSASGGFYPWCETNAPPANTNLNYPGLTANPSIDLIPHHGPYHYIVDDLRPFLANAGTTTVTLSGSPGYYVDGPPSVDSEPCSIQAVRDAPTAARTVRIWGGFRDARVGNAVGIDDFNADGVQDFLVGSPLTNEGAGACFIVLGRIRELVLSAELNIEELSLPARASSRAGQRIFDGIRVVGSTGDRLGQAQSSAGDFNNDGIADVLIGSPLVNNRRGGAAVVFGSREIINLTEDEIPFDDLPNRGLGVIFVGEEDGDLAGARVAGVRDIDGDGNDDVLIAAPNRSVRLDIDLDGTIEIDRTNCGVVYLVYGSPNLRGTISLSAIGSEQLPGVAFIGRNSGDFLGAGLGEQGDRSSGIGGAGDVDGDGINDILLGSVSASPRNRVAAGEAYLIYGVGD